MTTAAEPETALPASDLRPGQVLGRYELLMPIASGGMAMVWAARLKGTRGFQKIVAIKTILPKLSDDSQFEQMFLDEAAMASQIKHPHIVEILDLGEQSGVLFLVMEWIDGVPLNQLMKAAKKTTGLPLSIAIRIVMQACAGLHAAHELKNSEGELIGLVHRDVSPQNILVTYEGVTKVVDFGVAKATAAGEGSTLAGQIKGKVGYMAPEQVRAEPLDRRADVFAMGIILYALTTGKHPFRKDSEAATMYNICAPQPALPPRKIVADYPPRLEAVVLRALAKDRERRYATANDMLRALDHVLPASARANSDEDVAQFVRGLFAEREAEQRTALNDAMRIADERGPGALEGVVGPERQLGTPVSSISIAGQPHAETSGLTGASPLIAASTFSSLAAKKQRVPVVALAIGALVVAAVLYIVLGAPGEVRPTGASQAAATESAPVTPPPPEPTASASTTEATKPPVDITDIPEANDAGTEDAAAAKPPKMYPRPSQPKPSGPRGKGGDWRDNPGF